MAYRCNRGTTSSCTLLALLFLLGTGEASAQENPLLQRIPTLCFPPDSASALAARPHFQWQGEDSGSSYLLQIATDSAFTVLMVSDSVRADTSLLPREPLSNDSTYFWRVAVRDSISGWLFSTARTFTIASAIGLFPLSLFMGYVPNGDTSWAIAVVRNPMPFPVTLDSITSQTGQFGVPLTLPAVIDSLDSLSLPVRYAPRGFLMLSDSVRIHSMLGVRTLVVAGDSPPPLCMVRADTLKFRTVAHDDTASATIVLYNRGVVNPLQVHRLRHRSRAFQIRKSAPFTLGPRDSVLLPVHFVPAAIRPAVFGSFADTLLVDSNGGGTEIRLWAESPAPRLVTFPDTLDFGEIAFQDSVFRVVRLMNASVNPLRIDSVETRSDPFSVRPLRGLIRIGDTMQVEVRFLGRHYGILRDFLKVSDNAPGTPFCVPLQAVVPRPFMVSDTKALQFGEIPSKEAGRLTLAISNNSIGPLAIDSMTTRTERFQVQKFAAVTHLLKGDTLRVEVTFVPDTVGYFRDTLVIASNSRNSPFHVFLSGVGRAVQPAAGQEPGSFALFQNFPNPFNEMTTFRYALPERCSVRLVVINSLGQTIATIVDAEQEEGYHNVVWRPESASGMYFFKLIAVSSSKPDRQYVAAKRLMVLR
jgi:hypothetical protein